MADADLSKLKETIPPTDGLDKQFKDSLSKSHVTNEEFENHKENYNRHKKLVDWTFAFMIAVVALSLFTTATYVYDAWKLHSEREREYMETVRTLKTENSVKIDGLCKRIEILEQQKQQVPTKNISH